MSDPLSLRGWNLVLKAALEKARPSVPAAVRARRLSRGLPPGGSAAANLASAIACPVATVEAWRSGDSKPWPEKVRAMRKYIGTA